MVNPSPWGSYSCLAYLRRERRGLKRGGLFNLAKKMVLNFHIRMQSGKVQAHEVRGFALNFHFN